MVERRYLCMIFFYVLCLVIIYFICLILSAPWKISENLLLEGWTWLWFFMASALFSYFFQASLCYSRFFHLFSTMARKFFDFITYMP